MHFTTCTLPKLQPSLIVLKLGNVEILSVGWVGPHSSRPQVESRGCSSCQTCWLFRVFVRLGLMLEDVLLFPSCWEVKRLRHALLSRRESLAYSEDQNPLSSSPSPTRRFLQINSRIIRLLPVVDPRCLGSSTATYIYIPITEAIADWKSDFDL